MKQSYFYGVLIALIVGSAIFSSCGNDIPVNKTIENSSIIEEESSLLDDNSFIDSSSIAEDSSVSESCAATTTKKVTVKVSKKERLEDSSSQAVVEVTTTPETFYEANTTTEEIVAPAQREIGEAVEDSESSIEIVIPEKTIGDAPVESVVEVQKEEKIEVKEIEETSSQIEREFIVYKPSTHYVHRSTCHWVNDECYEITSTEGIEVRKCTECNPNIKIVKEYKEPTPTYGIDSYSRQLLAEIVWHEAGSNYISQYEKARVCAGVMNRVKDSRFPNTVYGVLTQAGQFSGYWPGSCTPTQTCYDAVDYYFSHVSEFGHENSWYGTGDRNHFYYQ